MLTQLWFAVNAGFVVLAIVFLFLNRSLQEAVRRGDGQAACRLRRQRLAAGWLTLLLFAAMSWVFLTNMRVNG